MIDLHTHLLPAIDDGPPTLSEAVELARATVAAGVRAVAATPHVSARYPNDGASVRGALEGLRRELDAQGVPLVVHPGGEVDAQRATELPDAELAALHLGAGPYLLLESPLTASAGDMEPLVAELQQRGHRVLLGHPERSPLFQREPGQVERLVATGALTSVTAGAVAGQFGGPARRLALDLLAEGLVHNLVSDMHDRRGRPPGIGAVLDPDVAAARGLRGAMEWLTAEVPAAILEGTPIPPGPALGARDRGGGRRSRWWRRRAGRR